MTNHGSPDFEANAELIDPALQEALELLDSEVDVRIAEIADRLNLKKDQVVALSVLFFATQLNMRDEGKMVIVCPRPAKAFEDPLAALFSQAPMGRYQEIYDQLMREGS